MSLLVQLGAFDPTADYTGKFCLMFRFGWITSIPDAHCTHKYFKNPTETQLQQILDAVDAYFKKNRVEIEKPKVWMFDKPSLLGEDKTPVLERASTEGMLLDLKEQLDEIIPDKFPTYRPHITIPAQDTAKSLTLIPWYYELSTGQTVIRSWTMGEKNMRLSADPTGKPKSRSMSDVAGDIKKAGSDPKLEPKAAVDPNAKLEDGDSGEFGAKPGEDPEAVVEPPTPGRLTEAEMQQNPKDLLAQDGTEGVTSDENTDGVNKKVVEDMASPQGLNEKLTEAFQDYLDPSRKAKPKTATYGGKESEREELA